MSRHFEGKLSGESPRVGIVVSRFNELITLPLLAGAQDTLRRHGVDLEQVDVAWVPGAFEIPIVAREMALSGRYDAVVCLGALIRGSTPHFEYLASAVSSAIQNIAIQHGVPCVFGVLTTDTLEQALERAGSKSGNKGQDAAVTAVEMVSVLRQMRSV